MKKIILAVAIIGGLHSGGSGAKQELSYSNNWLNVWKTDSSYIAIKKDGSLWRFGNIARRAKGILDKREKRFFLNPIRVMNHKRVVDISVANNRVYAIDSRGALWGWGREVRKNRYIKNPIKIGSKRDWRTIESVGTAEGGDCAPYTMAFDKKGYLYGWGDNNVGFIYYAPGSRISYNIPKNLGRYKKIAMGCYKVYGLRADGSVWEWGVATRQLLPKKVSPYNYLSLYKKLNRQRAKIGKFYLSLGDRGKSYQYNGISGGKLWLLPVKY